MALWFIKNIIIVRFVYGLSFFSLGLVVSMQHRADSRYRLAKGLRKLAAFALVHAFADWGLVFIPLQAHPDDSQALATLWGLKTILISISFGLLLDFGVGLLATRHRAQPHPVTRWIAPLITGAWLVAFFLYPLIREDAGLSQWYFISEIWSRYMLGLPAGMVAAIALADQADDLRKDRLHAYVRSLYLSAAFFMVYGLTSGLVVPKHGFWPASIINTEAFLQFTNIPIEIFRTAAVIGCAFFTARVLGIFNIETAHRIYRLEEERAILRERERIARDLHDGILQTLYGVGLGLREVEGRLEHEDRNLGIVLSGLTHELGGAIVDLRRAITNLRDDALPLQALVPAASECVNQVCRLSHLSVTLDVEGFDDGLPGPLHVPASFRDHVLALLREGLSNVARHAECERADVMLAFQDDTVILRIIDEGIGFDPSASLPPDDRRDEAHHGLRNLASRTKQLGGTVRIDSAPGKGTRLLFHIPVPFESDGPIAVEEV